MNGSRAERPAAPFWAEFAESRAAVAGLAVFALGLAAAFFGGRVETVLMRIVDLQLSFPAILLALVLVASLGQGLWQVVTALVAAQYAYVARTVHAVDRVSLAVGEGEVVGLVGESGCGKSTLGRIAAGLHAPDEGQGLVDGAPVAEGTGGRVAKRTTAVQMVFQDPFASLNPRMRVGDAIAEGPLAHRLWTMRERSERIAAALAEVGLDATYAARFPHQFSGGQRAQIGIARALAMNPRVVVADEAVFASPAHPYERGLLDAVPRLDRRRAGFQPVRGEIPSPLNPPAGCHFHPRCPHATLRCREERPEPRAIAPGREVACHLDLA